jgi:eukaryotic-like serine/threonine-protein kinase
MKVGAGTTPKSNKFVRDLNRTEGMTSMPPCPSDRTLRQLALDSLDPDVFAAMDAHIAGCDGCKQRLGRLVRECPSTESEAPGRLPAKANPPTIPGFEIERELGRGAMGVVYLARDQTLGRRVALKVMPGAQSANGMARKRWRMEAQAFSCVRHVNVVSLYEIGESESWLFLVLEFIPGGTLKNRLSGPVPQGVAASLVAHIAAAVQRIHSADLLHLDLKPSNILVDSEEGAPLDRVTPKVADFGIARIMQRDEAGPAQTGTTLIGPWGGTLWYMAPEQISGTRDQLGPGADIHALGAILYELLTGRPPFQGASDFDTLDLVRNTDAVSPRQINPRLSLDLETITLKCLRKEPKRRYESAQALADDLARYLENRPIRARPVSRPERAWRWCRRRPALAISLATLAATVLFSLLALHMLYSQAVAQRDRAEAALEREVKTRQIASTVIGTLHQMVDVSLTGRHLQGPDLLTNAKLLTEQIAKAWTVPGFDQNCLPRYSMVSERVALNLAGSGRLAEARLVMKDRLEFLRYCRDHDPGNEDQIAQAAEACLVASSIESGDTHSSEALGFLDQAASFIRNAGRDDPRRLFNASRLAGDYRRLQDQLTIEGHPEQANRARDGRISLFNLIDGEDPRRPDQMLLRACLLADIGDWGQARGLVELLFGRPCSFKGEPVLVREAVKGLVPEWFAREFRHWDEAGNIDKTLPLLVSHEIDHMFVLITNSVQVPEFEEYMSAVLPDMLNRGLFNVAASQRKAGWLDQADRTAALYTAFSQALVRRFPGRASWHLCLAEAYVQQSKNAWKRENMPAIKRALEQSIETLNVAIRLDPNDARIRRDLLDRTQRLAKLPRS